MRYQISGQHIDIGDALQTHVKEALGAAVYKYSHRPIDAVVTFTRSSYLFSCETTVHLSTGLMASAKGQANEIYAAFDSCCDKMEKQLRRYKRRLTDHHREREQPVEFGPGAAYILAASEEPEDIEPQTLSPVIIAEMETNIPSISTGEAVMQMELSGEKLLVFRNEAHGGVNVVYRRDDGNIGWIDPRNSK